MRANSYLKNHWMSTKTCPYFFEFILHLSQKNFVVLPKHFTEFISEMILPTLQPIYSKYSHLKQITPKLVSYQSTRLCHSRLLTKNIFLLQTLLHTNFRISSLHSSLLPSFLGELYIVLAM